MVLALLLSWLPAAEEWASQASPTTVSLRGLCAVDAAVCWASGAGGTVLRTTDGATWTRCPVPGAEELDFRDVHAFDAQRALVVSAGSPARVYRTEDGGANWSLTYENRDERAFFDAMAFWDEDHGLAFSDPIDGRLLVIRTHDGGRSWEELPASSFPPSPEGEAGFAASGTCLCVAGDQSAWIGLGGTAGARVFATHDRGAHWDVHATPLASGEPSRGVFSVTMDATGSGIAVGGDYRLADSIEDNAAFSTDGGATWSLASQPPSGFRSAVVRVGGSEPVWIAVGPNGTDRSRDGGRTWQRVSSVGFHAVASAQSPGGSPVVWAVGSGGRIARWAEVAEWNRFRGPNGTGIASGDRYPVQIGPGEHELWSRPFPGGISSPVLSATELFLTGAEGDELCTYALDRATGEVRWRRSAERPRRTKFHQDNHPAAASAAVDADVVVAFFDEFGLIAYDHAGEELWRHPLGPFDNIYGMAASPVLVDEVVVLPCDQQTNSFVLAVSKRTGEELWRVPRSRAVSGHCTPVVNRRDDGRAEVLLPGSFLLDAYESLTGERLWWVSGLPSEMKSVPVLLGDVVWTHGFASPINNLGNQLDLPEFAEALAQRDENGDGVLAPAENPEQAVRRYFQFLDLNGDGTLDEPEWAMSRDMLGAVNSAMAVRTGGSGDVTETHVLWRYYRSIPQLPSPLVYRDVYYMLNDQGGLLTTLDARSGEQQSRDRLEKAMDAYYASPVAGGGSVYLLSRNGVLSVLEAGSDEVRVVHTADFEQECLATPALEDGRIWLRTSERLYCFGE